MNRTVLFFRSLPFTYHVLAVCYQVLYVCVNSVNSVSSVLYVSTVCPRRVNCASALASTIGLLEYRETRANNASLSGWLTLLFVCFFGVF